MSVDSNELIPPTMALVAEHEVRVVRLLWQEYIVSRQTHRGGYLWQERAAEGPPKWFIEYELGLGIGQGPSIIETLQTLERDNIRRRKAFEKTDRQAPRKWKMNPKKKRRGHRKQARKATG
jgi:hypothetical protein